MNLHLSFSLKNFFKNIRPIIRTMADAVLNSHNIDAIESKSDEPEYDFKEYYSREKTLELRDIYIPYCTELFYRENPMKIVRCQGTYMYDQLGNKYLDCINNVAHVGHCHPHVVTQIYKQMGACATNNRYLHDNTVVLAEKLTKTLPEGLSQIFYTNSGSESNDLALRLAREYTGNYDILVLDNAYHGHLTTLVELSTYKQKQARTAMKEPEHVHIVPIADVYRGKYRDVDYNCDQEKLCELYVNEVRQAVENAEARGRRIAIFLIESFQSCGGQIIYPKGYLKKTFNYLQSKGILCLVDEVQTGFGRSGTHYWAFQSYEEDLVPDFVTMGKSMGNGFPVAALVTRREITEKFNINGIEYFNTYGGNPVSCRASIAVMDVVEKEKLMDNARVVGNYLIEKLKEIAERYEMIGDIRGRGLFIGVEIILDHKTRNAAIEDAREIKYRLREHMIIVSLDGPDHNVIKLKPPMCFSTADADFLCEKFETVVKGCQKKREEQQDEKV